MARFKNLLIICYVLLSACNAVNKKQDKKPAPTVTSVQGNFIEPTTKQFDSTAIAKFTDSFPLFKKLSADLFNFYRARNYSYAWFSEKGMIEQAGNLYNKVKNVEEEGILSSKLAYQKELSNIMDDSYSWEEADRIKVIVAELMLTAQYLQYANTVWVGLQEKESLSVDWLLPRKKISYSQTLDSLLSGKDVLSNAPVFRQYYLLKDYLKKYRLVEKVDTVKIPLSKTILKKGDSSSVIKAARYKLWLLGDVKEQNPSSKFDDSFETALESFQSRMGLPVTGKFGKADVAELNISIHQRIESLLVNMERSRWVTYNTTGNYLVVNIPEFKLHAFEHDVAVWNMNVVVGKNQHRTVVFNGNIRYVVFSPYWNIPPNIMKNETLPALRRNPNYLRLHNMEWHGNTIRQKPGPNNSLGLVKFLFPNSHSIYLHDSPAKSLFKETSRAFSHGCIRVADAEKLANYLLRNDTSWTQEKIAAAMRAGEERFITLNKPVPVFIAYFTAWVTPDGSLNFRKDIYERDKELLAMMISQ
ncbi:MAG: murein L,D-transpeptidase [Chitinophagaceae bacterium]|nr:MAG: murein L,D-transpeptidase [Chitinophagaceae bacterium]